jgi:drug/metabolite transporter (DMT)-like permease
MRDGDCLARIDGRDTQSMRRMPIVQTNAWAMLYSAMLVAVAVIAAREPPVIDWSARYLLSLLYLALFGSVLAFGAYVALLRRIGADRAGYTAVIIPVIALALSTLFESLRWHVSMVLGPG